MEINIPYYEDNTRISNSSLGWFKISPKYFYEKLKGNIKDEEIAAFKKGSMIHMYLLQEDEFWNNYVILDYEIPKSKEQRLFCELYSNSIELDHNLRLSKAFLGAYTIKSMSENKILSEALKLYNKYTDYIKYLNIQDKIVISWNDLAQLKTIKQNILNHKKAKTLLFNDSPDCETHNEFHINWVFRISTDTDTTIDCKSLIDRFIIDHKNKIIKLIDIKTTVSTATFNTDSFWKYEYGRQLAFYWLAIEWYFNEELKLDFTIYKKETYILAIQNNGLFTIKVFRIATEILNDYKQEITELLTDINWHKLNNLWEHNRAYYEGDGSELITNDTKRTN